MAKYYRNVIVNQAKAWIGAKEGSTTHKQIVDTYNSHKPYARGYKPSYKSAWCSLFVSAVSIKCGYTAIIPTEVSCHYHINLFKKLGIWVENDAYVPKAGDLILYDWQDSGKGDNKNSPDHIGIVEKVSGNTITVIEGNIDNKVGRRTIKVNAKYIRGYGVPKYDGDAEPVKEEPKVETSDKTSDNEKTSDIVYTVKKGDTLIGIANKYGTTYKKLAEYNGIKNPSRIDVGQKIRIPQKATATATSFKVGDKVMIIANGKSTASGSGSTTNAIGMVRYITKIHKNAKYPYQVGNKGKTTSIHTTGFFKENALKKA